MEIAIVGASGYTGGELLRLLKNHPHFDPKVISAHSNAGERITKVHPHLSHLGEARFSAMDIGEISRCDLVFMAMPHGESAKIISDLPSDQKIVDLGADFRLVESEAWKKYYAGDHAGSWTYGLPELHGSRELIKNSIRVANPGCYATAIALSVAPALPIIDVSDVVAVAASGTTGAGRSPKVALLGSEVMGSLSSYKFGGTHQHTAEIEQALNGLSSGDVRISFTPILAPMPRGILATVTARLISSISSKEAHALYTEYFKGEQFVDVLAQGEMPRTASVLGSNHAQMQVAIDEHTHRIVVSTAIDNLGKGAAGQAIQNANLISGFDENAGIDAVGVGI